MIITIFFFQSGAVAFITTKQWHDALTCAPTHSTAARDIARGPIGPVIPVAIHYKTHVTKLAGKKAGPHKQFGMGEGKI